METEQTQSPQGNGQDNGQPWYSSATSLQSSDPDVWSTFQNGVKSGAIKDLPSLVKNHVNLEKRLGSSIAPPPLTADPKDIAAFKAKVYQSGHFKAPPDSPEKYDIKYHESNKGLVDKFRAVAFDEGLPQQSVERITGAFNEWINETALPAIKADHDKANEALDRFSAEMKQEKAALISMGDRLISQIGREYPEVAEYLAKTPQAQAMIQHPAFMILLSKAGLLNGPDSGEIGNEMPEDMSFEEAKRIRNDATHPLYGAMHNSNDRNHEKVVEIVNRAYQKQIPG